MSYDYLFKIIFVGDVHVGKTALAERLTTQRFTDYYHTRYCWKILEKIKPIK